MLCLDFNSPVTADSNKSHVANLQVQCQKNPHRKFWRNIWKNTGDIAKLRFESKVYAALYSTEVGNGTNLKNLQVPYNS